MKASALLALACLLVASVAAAQPKTPVDLELVLAADGSGSIDEDELRLQRDGYARAITDPRVIDSIQFGHRQRIAIAYVEWGGPSSQHTIVDWMVISDKASAEKFASDLRSRPRAAYGYNSISNALVYSADLIATNAYEGPRKIIDVSGDGPQMGGLPLPTVRAATVAQGITINGLAIDREGSGRPGGARFGISLEEHFSRDVIGGVGAFVIVANRELSFADAVLRKLILEIASNAPSGNPTTAGLLHPPAPRSADAGDSGRPAKSAGSGHKEPEDG